MNLSLKENTVLAHRLALFLVLLSSCTSGLLSSPDASVPSDAGMSSLADGGALVDAGGAGHDGGAAGHDGGRAFPAWRIGMTPNTWKALGTSSISDVNPAMNAAINPRGAGTDSPWRGSDGQLAVLAAWGSAVWDEAGQTLWIPIGGGHGNYAGNESYRQPLGDAAPAWQLVHVPSGAVGNTISLDDGLESTGAYGDGRPRSPHTYNNVAFADGVGPVIVRIAAPYSDSNKPTQKVFRLDQNGNTTLVFDFRDAASVGFPNGWPGGFGEGGATNGAACFDSKRNRIYSVGTGRNTYMLWCRPTTMPGMWTGGHLPTSVYLSEQRQGLEYIPTIDRLLHFQSYQGTLSVRLVHPDTGVTTPITVTGSFAAGVDWDTQPGGTWSPELGTLVVWNNLTNRAELSTLTPVGDGLATWRAGTLAGSAASPLSPPVRAANGTFGMLRYSSSLRGVVLVTSNTTPTWFYATE